MSDPLELAQQAMDALTPLIPLAAAAAGHVADGFLSEPGAKLYEWLTSKFKGRPEADALNNALAEPTKQLRLEALKLAIAQRADEDSEFRQQLSEMVYPSTEMRQTNKQRGDGNKSGQIIGNNSSVQIS
jgi:hypothetical protein